MLAVVLAFLALIALRSSWRSALVFVWLFNLEGTADLINAFALGIGFNIAGHYHLGLAWLIPTHFVPAALVIHFVIFVLLLRRNGRSGMKHVERKLAMRVLGAAGEALDGAVVAGRSM
ncbi:MAG: hypothetical protein ABI068_15825 [Ktedonobacterales bacterium]